jgi:nucleoside-diphosphate-sugar epimerase
MVYDTARGETGISEEHSLNPASPYASTKLAADFLALSYHRAYGLPVTVVRPFNTYGPYQKTNQEGGVVAVFLRRALDGKPLQVFGDGTQTRDLMYVDDCADLIVRAANSKKAVGETINGGSGKDISVNDLAKMIAGPKGKVGHVPHPHPQSEIRTLLCAPSKAERILGWRANVSLEEGIRRTREWMAG